MNGDNNKSYKHLILELILKIAIAIIVFFIGTSGRKIDNRFINIGVSLLLVAIMMYCIYSISISAARLSELYDNRERVLKDDILKRGKQYNNPVLLPFHMNRTEYIKFKYLRKLNERIIIRITHVIKHIIFIIF